MIMLRPVEETTMKNKMISLRRRHLMIAAAAGLAAPACAWTLPAVAMTANEVRIAGGEKLIVSGRILDAHGQPAAHASIDAWHADVHRTSVVADADGRFMFTTTTPTAGSAIDYRVSHAGATTVRQLTLTPRPHVSAHAQSQVRRDEQAVWRTTFALTLA